MIAGLIAIPILIALAALHLYWAAGGKSGRSGAIPTLHNRPILKPTPLITAIVAFGLLAMAAIISLKTGLLTTSQIPTQKAPLQWGAWTIAGIFALRAVGDFKYVGFFKKVRDSRFAQLDTLAYSPLCAALALLTAIAAAK